MKLDTKKRIESIDISRGLIVFLSVLLVSIPIKISGINVHAEWYGITVMDLIFPAFITIFGTSMAIAYRKGVNRKRLISRTIKLILLGLVYNIIVSWSLDLSTLRFTGVLQLFAILGVVTVLITRVIKKPGYLIITSLLLFTLHGFFIVQSASSCDEKFPEPECSPSSYVDPLIIGENHIYALGDRGYDPEGIPSMFAALGNVLLGFAAGQLILRREKETQILLFYTVLLFLFFLISWQFMPIGKRIWTPSFGLLTSGVTILILTGSYMLFDGRSRPPKLLNPIQWFLIAFGRNSFLLYFGKYLLSSVMKNVTLTINGTEQNLQTALMSGLESNTSHPNLYYTGIIFGFWAVIAVICHWRKWYVKI